MTPVPPRPVLPVRTFGAVNWRGLWTLYAREVKRFAKMALQTIVAPAITSLLFLVVFSIAMGRSGTMVGGVPFDQFLAPGLIMMAVIQNAFQNATSTLMVSKIQGNIVDLLMPPLTAGELMLGFALGGATRGLVVGVVVGAMLYVFVPFTLASIAIVLGFAVLGALLMSVAGVIVGIWANKFDDIATITNFLVTPLTFLSGTFYSVDRLPPLFQQISHANPFFYMIDGFRSGFIGHADSPSWIGLGLLIGLNAILWTLCYRLLATGYKLKA